MIFRLYAWRFRLRAMDAIRFADLLPENTFRGALGCILRRMKCEPVCGDAAKCPRVTDCEYRRFFEPRSTAGPSGLADLPRPFVLRASHLAGKECAPGETFEFDVHVFDLNPGIFEMLAAAVQELEQEGLGPRRGRARLESIQGIDLRGNATALPLQRLELSLSADPEKIGRVMVRFVTPTELKGSAPGAPFEFAVLFGRVRDRIANLSEFFGSGPLDVDFRQLKETAQEVRRTAAALIEVHGQRRSSRTGQRHPLRGFVGTASFEGELAVFMPWLKCAYWTGVGRQTVWGKGVVRTEAP